MAPKGFTVSVFEDDLVGGEEVVGEGQRVLPGDPEGRLGAAQDLALVYSECLFVGRKEEWLHEFPEHRRRVQGRVDVLQKGALLPQFLPQFLKRRWTRQGPTHLGGQFPCACRLDDGRHLIHQLDHGDLLGQRR